jgi:lycopene cyclase domain-containing protein
VERYQYLILLGACVVVTAPLELFGHGVYRQLRRAAVTVIPVAIVFIAWDVLAIAGGVWTYNPRYLVGLRVGNIPVEELLFFVVIPLCGLLTYSAVSNILAWLSRRRIDRRVSR